MTTEAETIQRVRDLLATWVRNRADERYGQGAPHPLYACGMANEADCMIAGLRAALGPDPARGEQERSERP